MYKKIIAVMLGAAFLAFGLCACSGSSSTGSASGSGGSSAASSAEDSNAPIYLEIGEEVMADVDDGKDGKARLQMDYSVTNTSEARTAQMSDLPQLTLNGKPVEATYTHQDSTKTELAPGETVYAHVDFEYDEKADHEWRFKEQPGTVVSRLDRYVAIIEAERNYEGLPQVTQEEIDKMEAEQKAAYEEFLKEEASREAQAK